jgi:putative inorganic carbon (HCO3(-)) transporter
MSAKFEKLGIRWGLIYRVAVTLAFAYMALAGGTIPGTSHFPSVVVSHLVTMAVLIGWTAHRFLHRRWLPKTPLDLPLLVFYLLNMISTVFSTEPRLSLESLLYLTLFILVYYLVVDLLTSGWPVSSLVRSMLTAGGVVILVELVELGLWLGLQYEHFGELSALQALERFRQRVVMGPANVLAWYIVLLLPLALAQLLRPNSRKAKITLSAWVIGATLLFSSTLSRSGFLAMAVALAAFAVLILAARFRLQYKPLITHLHRPAVIASILLVIAAAAVLSTITLRLAPARVGTIFVRLELWRAAAEIIASRPLFGAGPGTFGYLFHQVPDFDPLAEDLFHSHAHNGYINVAAETGLPSLLTGLWIIAVLVIVGWKGLGKPDDSSSCARHANHHLVTSACLAGILGLLAAMLFDVLWGSPLITIHVIMLTAIILTPCSSIRRPVTGLTRWITPIVVGAAVGFLVWSDSAHYLQYTGLQSIADGDLSDGIGALNRASSIDAFMSVYHFQLGVAQGYLALEKHDETVLHQAMAAFETEISRGGDTAINSGNLAWLEWRAGDLEGALSHMERAVTLAPGKAYYQLGLGFLLEDVGNYRDAREPYGKAIRLEPFLIDSGFWQASAYRRSIKTDMPRGDEFPAQTLAQMAYFAGDYPRAIELLDGQPQSVSSYVVRGQIETEQGNFTAALEHLNAALDLAEANPTAYLARGELYLRMGEESKAVHDLITGSFLGLKHADIALGEMAYQAGDMERAIASYGNGIPDCRELEPYYYARLVYHRSDLEADFWPDLITCAPYDSLIPEYLHMARAYRQTGLSEKADDLCQWLAGFYEATYLRQMDEGNDNEWPCPGQLQ